MAYMPMLQEIETVRSVTDVFGGYDHNLKAPEGTWYEENGLSARAYPLFAAREPRGRMFIGNSGRITQIACRDKLAWVQEDGSLWYDGECVETGLMPGEKQLISMGALVCVFPDGFYFNTHDLKDRGRMGNLFTYSGEVDVRMCGETGIDTDTDQAYVSDTEPEEPQNGEMWIDTSRSIHVLKKWSYSSAQWAEVTNAYVKISAPGIGKGFRKEDGVRVSGLHLLTGGSAITKQIEALNADCILQDCGDDHITVPGILDRAVTAQAIGMRVERRVPAMDYVCACGNRLWGCRYGAEDGKNVNTIYACAQGDCTNWYRYAGISTDSYAVNIGTDGPFTGIIEFGGAVLAWKEDHVHKVYGSMPAQYSVTTVRCRGVAAGSARSLAVVNENLYYLSRGGVCMYDGTVPRGISDAFAGERFCEGIAGVQGNTYVICMRTQSGRCGIWSYMPERGIWHHMLDDRVIDMTDVRGECVYLNADGEVYSLCGRYGEKEKPVEFDAVSGAIGYAYPQHKYLGRMVLRVRMGIGDRLEISIRCDADGEWKKCGEVHAAQTGSFALPVVPRRCDHFYLRIRGRGDVKIFSITKVLEVGSDAM